VTVVSIAAAAVLVPMLLVAFCNLVAARRLESAVAPRSLPRVSLLVPARNEGDNLRATLPALLRLEYPHLEILVLDDESDDDTADVVRAEAARSDGRLRLLAGSPPPAGWLGKSWACHQLFGTAEGEVLVFCDADVTSSPSALLHTIGAMEAERAGALTALPRQRLDAWAARAVVPLVAQLPVLSLLPLPLVSRTSAPSLSLGNGQWFAFRRRAYLDAGGHASVRGEVHEDVVLARRVKAAGHRLAAVVACTDLEVRMYRDFRSVREGFGKNLYALVGGRPATLAAALLLFSLTAVLPWLAVTLGALGALLPLGLLVAIRACGVLLFGHRPETVLLHPIGSLLTIWIAAESYLGAKRGTVRWKGRLVAAAPEP
jgi:hypothetical protein